VTIQTIIHSGFQLYFGIQGYTQGLFKDFQGPWSCIFKDQFSTEVTARTVLKQHVISISVITGQF